jgi:hypothetical protein
MSIELDLAEAPSGKLRRWQWQWDLWEHQDWSAQGNEVHRHVLKYPIYGMGVLKQMT